MKTSVMMIQICAEYKCTAVFPFFASTNSSFIVSLLHPGVCLKVCRRACARALGAWRWRGGASSHVTAACLSPPHLFSLSPQSQSGSLCCGCSCCSLYAPRLRSCRPDPCTPPERNQSDCEPGRGGSQRNATSDQSS